MQIMITHGSLAQTRVLQLSPVQVGALLVAGALALMALSAVIYHFVLVRAVRDGWPVVSQAAALLARCAGQPVPGASQTPLGGATHGGNGRTATPTQPARALPINDKVAAPEVPERDRERVCRNVRHVLDLGHGIPKQAGSLACAAPAPQIVAIAIPQLAHG